MRTCAFVRPDGRTNGVKCSLISCVNWMKENQNRAGVIPYIIYKGKKVMFCMGIDRISRDLTDFGGKVEIKDANPVYGGLREFKEESLGVFGEFIIGDVSNDIVLYNDNMMIMFVKLEVDPRIVTEQFKQKIRQICNPEVSDIVWLHKEELLSLISGKCYYGYKVIYSRVKNFLSNALDKVRYIGTPIYEI